MIDIATVRPVDFQHPVEAVIPGAQGRILAVLIDTTAALNLRTLARLARVSPAQVSRVVPGLVGLGLVEREEVPPSSLFRLAHANVAAQAIIQLSRSRETVLEQIGEITSGLPTPPDSVILFGSFVRNEAGVTSDIDTVIVRPDEIDDEDDSWQTSIQYWRQQVGTLAGNPVEVVEVGRTEAASKLKGRSEFWRKVRRDGLTAHGLGVVELIGAADG
jgi:predicted nucleotidyltransferase